MFTLIEGYGSLKSSWVQDIKDNTSVIEFNIEKGFIPGFYLSVIVISSRVDILALTTEQIDLEKPVSKSVNLVFAKGNTLPEQSHILLKNLSEYCKLNTYAMVELLEMLKKI